MLSYDFRATANYNTNFGEDHIINLFAGTEANSIDRNKTYFNGWGMQYSMGEIPFYVYQFFKKALKMVQTIIHLPIQPAVQLLSSGMPLTPIKGNIL